MRNKYICVLTLINLFCPIAFGLSEEMQELANMLHSTCIGETGVSEENIQKAKTGDFVDDEKLKCYIMCTMAQMACINENGIIDVEATIAVLPEEFQEMAAPIIRKCDTQKGKSPCENAWLTHKCYYNENPQENVIKILRDPRHLRISRRNTETCKKSSF